MLDFNKIIDVLLTEQPAIGAPGAVATTSNAPNTATTASSNSQWVKDIVDKYNELYSSKGDSIREEDVAELWPLVVKGYITDGEIISIGVERAKILDVLKEIYNSFTGKKPNDFQDLVNTADAKKTTDIINRLKAAKTPEDWSMKNGDVIRAYNIARSGADRASAVALETFNQSTIFNTVQEIVRRRTNAFDAISVLKSPTTPFKSLLQDIFKTPEQYLSGQKKVTSDWNNIVDSLYITTICNIALNTKDLFKSLVQPPKQPVNAGLELFTGLVEQVLLEVNTGPGTQMGGNQTYTPTSTAPTATTVVPSKDYTKDEAAYNNFYINGALPVDVSASKDENGKPVVYNIKKISELITPEAQKLITSLRNIAHYEKAKPGAGERMAGAQQALQGVASFAGAKLYT